MFGKVTCTECRPVGVWEGHLYRMQTCGCLGRSPVQNADLCRIWEYCFQRYFFSCCFLFFSFFFYSFWYNSFCRWLHALCKWLKHTAVILSTIYYLVWNHKRSHQISLLKPTLINDYSFKTNGLLSCVKSLWTNHHRYTSNCVIMSFHICFSDLKYAGGWLLPQWWRRASTKG